MNRDLSTADFCFKQFIPPSWGTQNAAAKSVNRKGGPLEHAHFLSYEPVNLQFEPLITFIDNLASLPQNWDGYGALRVNEQTVKNARHALEVLLTIAPAPEITPNSNGTISFEWETRYGYAHLEIGLTRFSLYLNPSSGGPYMDDGQVDQIGFELGSLIKSILYPSPSSVCSISKVHFSNVQTSR